MAQYTQAGRDALQAETINLNIHPPADQQDQAETGAGAAGPWLGWPGLIVAIVVIVVSVTAVLVAIGDAVQGAEDPPKADRPWPPGATRDMVLAPVVAKLKSCAEALVADPENCPQRTDKATGRVRWRLEGDAADGADPTRYDGHRFDVIGHAVMTVSYHRPWGGPRISVQKVPYRASVAWNNGRPALTSLTRTSATPRTPITKQARGVTWNHIKPVLQIKFGRCISAPISPMPADCPESGDSTPHADHATWTQDGDPVQNARLTWDQSWGLFHVIGDYAFTRHTNNPFTGPTSTPRQGHYDATLIVKPDGIAKVLKITKT